MSTAFTHLVKNSACSGWPEGGLGVAWDDATIRELSGNYLGTIRDFGRTGCGTLLAWLAGSGRPGLAGLAWPAWLALFGWLAWLAWLVGFADLAGLPGWRCLAGLEGLDGCVDNLIKNIANTMC